MAFAEGAESHHEIASTEPALFASHFGEYIAELFRLLKVNFAAGECLFWAEIRTIPCSPHGTYQEEMH